MSGPVFTGECFVGGRWVTGGGAEFSSISPADGVATWTGREAGPDEVEAAVRAARQAFPGWRRTPIEQRIEHVRAFAKLLESR